MVTLKNRPVVLTFGQFSCRLPLKEVLWWCTAVTDVFSIPQNRVWSEEKMQFCIIGETVLR